MDLARNPPSGTQLLQPSNGAWSYPSGAWYKHPDTTCQYNRSVHGGVSGGGGDDGGILYKS